MMRRVWMVVVLGLIAAQLSPAPLKAQSTEQCFDSINFCINGPIAEFWMRNGGMRVFGLPIEPERLVLIDGVPRWAQRFERSRIELWPGNPPPYDVQLGRLGDELLRQQGRDWFSFPASDPQRGCRYFAETRHNICEPFLSVWRHYGVEFDGQVGKSVRENLALFGLPLSDTQSETVNGREYIVQWFERARFELHLENRLVYRVLFGRLGAELRPDLAAHISLPKFDMAMLDRVVNDPTNEIVPSDLAPEHSAVYALPDRGVAFFLTPPRDFVDRTFPDIDVSKLATDLWQLAHRMIGGLTVVLGDVARTELGGEEGLPPDHYVLTVDDSGTRVRLVGGRKPDGSHNEFEVPLIVRELDYRFPRPVALVSAVQQCINATATFQLCPQIVTPPEDISRQLSKELERLTDREYRPLVPSELVAFDRATPDIEGIDGIERCIKVLDQEPPRYNECLPTIIGAPLKSPFEARSEESRAITNVSIAVLTTLEPIRYQQYEDVTLARSVAELPRDVWLVSAVKLPEDRIIRGNEHLRAARVRLEGPSNRDTLPKVYLPAVIGVQAIGRVGQEPRAQSPETAILAWYIDWFGVCLWGEAECTASY